MASDQENDSVSIPVPKPSEIHAFFDNYIIGQAYAKKIISVAVYNHYKRLLALSHSSDVEIQKSKQCFPSWTYPVGYCLEPQTLET